MKFKLLASAAMLLFCACSEDLGLAEKQPLQNLANDNPNGSANSTFGPALPTSFWKGANNNNIYYSKDSYPNVMMVNNGASTSKGPAAVRYNNYVFMFHKGLTNNNLYYSFTSDGVSWPGDHIFSNGAKTDSSPSATVFRGKCMFVMFPTHLSKMAEV